MVNHGVPLTSVQAVEIEPISTIVIVVKRRLFKGTYSISMLFISGRRSQYRTYLGGVAEAGVWSADDKEEDLGQDVHLPH